ncbi:MAG: S1 RNA-binding domain-containing protein [Clostridiales bacterium]|nr:S1 RNA-binding domain-containing protein [Clostridiales bacterium]
MTEFYPEGGLKDRIDNRYYLKSLTNLSQAKNEQRILEARAIVCDAQHNLIVDLECCKGIIYREEGALGIKEGTVRDIAVISRVNRPVCFVVTGFEKDEVGNTRAVLSRTIAQKRCMQEYLLKLTPGDIIPAKITHIEAFGAFADVGCGIASLMPIDTISVSRIDNPRQRFTVGMNIMAVVKLNEGGRISLSMKELLGTWQQNADRFSIGETVSGIIRSVEEYGAFVELTPNLAGLAELKKNIAPGMLASVYIKNIIPEKMKVKLIIIETFENNYRPEPPYYYITEGHLSTFKYSPDGCERSIVTVFDKC